MKNYKHIPDLIFKKMTDNLSDKENQELESWINLNDENKNIYQETIKDENIKSALKKYFKYDVDAAWKKTEKRLVPKSVRLISNKLLRYAALLSVPLLIAGYLIFQYISDSSDQFTKTVTELPFEPGNQKALLTTSSGEEIALGQHINAINIKVSESTEVTDTNYTLVYESETEVPEAIEYNTLQTPKGGEYGLVLADGSKVWLNADSKLKYPIQFSEAERKVFIEGEAYFEITENKNRPFVVQTNGYDIHVLGTSFNVMAYTNEQQIATTLVEGSVEITKPESAKPVYLAPGQQAILQSESKTIEVKAVDTYQYTAWKDGLFVFESEPLGSIVNKFSRWYNCEIQFVDPKLKETKFTGTLNRDTDLAKLLNIISQSCQIDFTVNENNVLTISKKK